MTGAIVGFLIGVFGALVAAYLWAGPRRKEVDSRKQLGVDNDHVDIVVEAELKTIPQIDENKTREERWEKL